MFAIFQAFLQVCKCMYPKLQVQASNLTSFKNVENIEVLNSYLPLCSAAQYTIINGVLFQQVPASAIWSLLLFSELFGVHKLHEECVNKLCKMFRRDNEPKLPVSVTSELSSKNLKEVETNLQTYFSNHVAPEANRNGVYDTTASASIPVSTEPATVSSRKTTNMHRYVSGNPERTTGITTSVYAPTCSTHKREDALYQEYFNGYSDINQKVIDEQAASRTIRAQLRAPPISSLLSTPVAVPEIRRNPHEEYHDYHVSIVGTPSSFSAHKHQQQQQQQQELQWRQNQHDCVYPQHISLLPGNAQQGKPSSPLEITDYGYSSAEEVGSEDSFGEDDRYTHREGALRYVY